MIFYGPPGVGKTTLAALIARQTKRKLCKLNGTTASTADIRDVVSSLDTHRRRERRVCCTWTRSSISTKSSSRRCWSLSRTDNITLIASTTENPYFYVYSAILSRCDGV